MNWRIVTTKQDLIEAKAIRRAVFIEEQGIAEELEHDEYDALTASCTHIIVSDHEQQPIGTGRLRYVRSAQSGGSQATKGESEVLHAGADGAGENEGHAEVDSIGKLERIAVLQHVRGGGCGRIIVQALEGLARQSGVSKVKLGAQLPVQSFYERLGYTVVSDVFIDAGIEHVLMEKQM